MILPIVKYGHPVLRQKGARVERLDAAIHALIADMFETMQSAAGVGLAAQQVGRPLQLAVIDVRGIKDRPSTLEWDGAPVEVNDFMPLVLINPVVKAAGEPLAGPEGCLSFPEIFGEIVRPGTAEVQAMNQKSERYSFRCSGLLARAIQHEVDHLQGILFIDRMNAETREELAAELKQLQTATKQALKQTGRPL